MIHGGDILTYKNMYNGEIIDYSSNINPLGPPECFNEAVNHAVKRITMYPDIKYRGLKREIGKYLGCSGSQVIVGNGAVEIIDNISSLFNRIIVSVPCFMEYIIRPRVIGKDVVMVNSLEDFSIDKRGLIEKMRAGDLILLGNPNNPTGKRIKKDVLISIQREAEKRGAYILLDEAFCEFCPTDYDSIEIFKGCSNIFILRAATKFFALPGIRLGYACVTEKFAAAYDRRALPWSVNAFADAAGRAVLKDRDYIKRTKEYIGEQREYMLKELESMNFIKTFDTVSNFILIKLLIGDEDSLFNYMIKKGILIRKASSFVGLDKSYIRLAIKDSQNNQYLIKCLTQFKQSKGHISID